jgi:endonuclease/exonuclease/phosphatase family metal-dependent hydrolase
VGIDPGSQFFVTVVPDRYNKRTGGSRVTAAGVPFPAPSTAPAFTTSVGSYNVTFLAHPTDAAGRDWAQRLPQAGQRIADLDLVGVQEVGWTILDDQQRPVEQLASAAGLQLASLPDGTPCAKKTIHILLKSEVFEVQACGTEPLPGNDNRYALWAVVVHRASGRSVFVVNTHLQDGKEAADAATRRSQAAAVGKVIGARNSGGLPVILLGDLNAYETMVADSPPTVLGASGLVGANLVAAERRNAEFASSHGWAEPWRFSEQIDHIMTSAGIVVDYFEVRAGPVADEPSDHFPVAARLTVHR